MNLSVTKSVRAVKYRRLRWAGHVVRIQEGRSVFKILAGKAPGKSTPEHPWRRRDDNIRMYLNTVILL